MSDLSATNDTQPVLLERHPDGVACLIINRPERRNALNSAAMTAFAQGIAALAKDADIRAVVVTGQGHEAFCSGGDLVELREKRSAADGQAMAALMGDALQELKALPVPVIAGINGYALGGGSEIAVACDLRIADTSARLGFVQIHMALTPGWGAGQRLAALVGIPKALEILLGGDVIDASSAAALGLLNRIVPAGTARQAALAWAHEIASKPPGVVRGIKALLAAASSQPHSQALAAERQLFPALWEAPAHWQAVDAFFARQPRTG